MKRALILTGGDAPDTLVLDTSGFYIIAADSGLQLAERYKLRVNMYVGDNDSLADMKLLKTLTEGEKQVFPTDKDHTDTELAIQHAHDAGCDEITLVGGGGGREDHFLAILSLFDREVSLQHWYTANSTMEAISDRCILRGYQNTQVSFFPLGIVSCYVKSTGLQWNLDNVYLHRGDFSVSNIIVGNVCEMLILQGRLLMILNTSKQQGKTKESSTI